MRIKRDIKMILLDIKGKETSNRGKESKTSYKKLFEN